MRDGELLHLCVLDCRVWSTTRGGFAKATQVLNVSEDIFAGFTCALRGGDSEHVNFYSAAKGRDVGILQIMLFEGKISAGTAISMTTRDSFRVFEGMNLPRLLSFYHTCGGFYFSNLFIVAAFAVTLYYYCMLALTGLDHAIVTSGSVFLVGDISALQWMVQLGILSIAPLFSLNVLEHGLLGALQRSVVMILTFSPIFYMLEILTKAWFFDHALCFGRTTYMATGVRKRPPPFGSHASYLGALKKCTSSSPLTRLASLELPSTEGLCVAAQLLRR